MAWTVKNQAKAGEHHQNSVKNVEGTYCTTATIVDYACHGGRCHNTTTYIRDCDVYNGDACDNITTRFDICNSTLCRNTTRRIDACYSDVSDNCGNADFTFRCCTNGDCRNRTTHIHACYSDKAVNLSLHRAAATVCAADSICYPFFPPDAACVDGIIDSFNRRMRLLHT